MSISSPKTRKIDNARQTHPTPPKGYEECKSEISVRMGHFFLRYLTRLYQEFEGDLALVIVLGEIGHHNASQFYHARGPKTPKDQRPESPQEIYSRLEACNAFSISGATGIPRETVRRKIATLIKRGWVQRNARGEVVITPAVAAHFQSDFNIKTLNELLALSDQLRTVLTANHAEHPHR